MSAIDRLTQTHANLERQLMRFADVLGRADDQVASTAIAEMQSQLDVINRRLEAHLDAETELEERSDFILGEDSFADYDVPEHHRRMRSAVGLLRRALDADAGNRAVAHHFGALLYYFDRYTAAELAFIRENGAILFPGGSGA